jgi:O-acetyl-ADP-ribose deacetylase (regulator of RNase III)
VSIEHGEGDLTRAAVDALVNPVNTVGVMGKGLALQIKRAFPDVFAGYGRACKQGEVQVGRMHVVHRATAPRFVINFPTKKHWRDSSKLEYIVAGLSDLVTTVDELHIGSIAIPPLGCGLGGLDWTAVKPRIVAAFRAHPDVRVVLFEPTADMS